MYVPVVGSTSYVSLKSGQSTGSSVTAWCKSLTNIVIMIKAEDQVLTQWDKNCSMLYLCLCFICTLYGTKNLCQREEIIELFSNIIFNSLCFMMMTSNVCLCVRKYVYKYGLCVCALSVLPSDARQLSETLQISKSYPVQASSSALATCMSGVGTPSPTLFSFSLHVYLQILDPALKSYRTF